jgi:hypothetical protein
MNITNEYHKQIGSYPTSLTNLKPKYLATLPEVADREHDKITGWDYQTITKSATISYSLRYYMGRGGVEYEPPEWIGNDEGHRTVILKNK